MYDQQGSSQPSGDKSLVILSHVLGLLTGFVGPLILFVSSQDLDVKRHAKMALNWQITLVIYAMISLILTFVLIGFVLLPLVFILDLVFCILATLKAKDGIFWEYPLTLKIIK